MSATAAEVYDEFFVPALFAQWPDTVLDVAGLIAGDDVLDVGCGTGILARVAARRLAGTVTGLDANQGMLDVAGRAPEPVTWQHGYAERLPFPDRSFDRVVSQFVLMFVSDRTAAVAEMARVARPGGTLTVATWADIEQSPGYAAMAGLLHRLFGPATAEGLRVPFGLGDPRQLRELLASALPDVAVRRYEGTARFASVDAWVHTDIRGWTLAERIDEEQYRALVTAARTELAGFVRADGGVEFAATALIATGPAPRG